jgi:hypothetical protein
MFKFSIFACTFLLACFSAHSGTTPPGSPRPLRLGEEQVSTLKELCVKSVGTLILSNLENDALLAELAVGRAGVCVPESIRWSFVSLFSAFTRTYKKNHELSTADRRKRDSDFERINSQSREYWSEEDKHIRDARHKEWQQLTYHRQPAVDWDAFWNEVQKTSRRLSQFVRKYLLARLEVLAANQPEEADRLLGDEIYTLIHDDLSMAEMTEEAAFVMKRWRTWFLDTICTDVPDAMVTSVVKSLPFSNHEFEYLFKASIAAKNQKLVAALLNFKGCYLTNFDSMFAHTCQSDDCAMVQVLAQQSTFRRKLTPGFELGLLEAVFNNRPQIVSYLLNRHSGWLTSALCNSALSGARSHTIIRIILDYELGNSNRDDGGLTLALRRLLARLPDTRESADDGIKAVKMLLKHRQVVLTASSLEFALAEADLDNFTLIRLVAADERVRRSSLHQLNLRAASLGFLEIVQFLTGDPRVQRESLVEALALSAAGSEVKVVEYLLQDERIGLPEITKMRVLAKNQAIANVFHQAAIRRCP